MIILLSVENDVNIWILTAEASSGAEISTFEVLKLKSGTTTLKSHFSKSIVYPKDHFGKAYFDGKIILRSRVIVKVPF